MTTIHYSPTTSQVPDGVPDGVPGMGSAGVAMNGDYAAVPDLDDLDDLDDDSGGKGKRGGKMKEGLGMSWWGTPDRFEEPAVSRVGTIHTTV